MARLERNERYKRNLVYAYDRYVKFKGLSWIKPWIVKFTAAFSFCSLNADLKVMVTRVQLVAVNRALGNSK
jgi:hypothetical protein